MIADAGFMPNPYFLPIGMSTHTNALIVKSR